MMRGSEIKMGGAERWQGRGGPCGFVLLAISRTASHAAGSRTVSEMRMIRSACSDDARWRPAAICPVGRWSFRLLVARFLPKVAQVVITRASEAALMPPSQNVVPFGCAEGPVGRGV